MKEILCQNPFIAVTELTLDLPDVTELPYIDSAVLNHATGQVVTSDQRTSSSWQDDSRFQWLAAAMLNQINSTFDQNYTLDRCEPLIVSRYCKDQLFAAHKDYALEPSPRTATIMLYFNDDYLGGCTYFDLLGITVRPKQGKLLYWTYPEDSQTRDQTSHMGQHVVRGVKYVATLWIR